MAVNRDDRRRLLADFLEEYGDVLVEVQFLKMGTSADYYLFDDEQPLLELVDTLANGVKVRLMPAWNIGAVEGEKTFTVGE